MPSSALTNGWATAHRHPVRHQLSLDDGSADVRMVSNKEFHSVEFRDHQAPEEARWTITAIRRADNRAFVGQGPTNHAAWTAAIAAIEEVAV